MAYPILIQAKLRSEDTEGTRYIFSFELKWLLMFRFFLKAYLTINMTSLLTSHSTQHLLRIYLLMQVRKYKWVNIRVTKSIIEYALWRLLSGH